MERRDKGPGCPLNRQTPSVPAHATINKPSVKIGFVRKLLQPSRFSPVERKSASGYLTSRIRARARIFSSHENEENIIGRSAVTYAWRLRRNNGRTGCPLSTILSQPLV